MTRFSTVNADTLLMVESLNRKNEKQIKKEQNYHNYLHHYKEND